MCRRVNCSQCGKPSFAGCGMHVEQVLGDVPKPERCCCQQTQANTEPVESAWGSLGSFFTLRRRL